MHLAWSTLVYSIKAGLGRSYFYLEKSLWRSSTRVLCQIQLRPRVWSLS